MKPALELDPTLEPKLIFQKLVLFREDLDTNTPPKEQVELYYEDECDKDELLFQAKFEDEFNKFCEESFSNQVEPETNFSEPVLVPKSNILEPKSITSTNYILLLD